MKSASIDPGTRVVSLDQFRGYTIVAMLVVNVAAGFAALPDVLKHHNTYNSYADTVMPHFFFAVGFAMRLGMQKGVGRAGLAATRRAMRWRGLALVLLGVVFHGLDGHYRAWAEMTALGWWGVLSTAFLRLPFQTLTHIGLTTLWMLPVMHRRSRDLAVFAAASGLLHLVLSQWFWYETVKAMNVIDGGPLGFLTWTLPTMAGALAYDAVSTRGPAGALRPLVRGGVLLALLGYALSSVPGTAAPPFLPSWRPADVWTMSQQAGSVSYQTFNAGFSLLVYSLFLWACDVRRHGWQWALFTTLGTNALAAYLLHYMVLDVVGGYSPKDAPVWWAVVMITVLVLVTWRMVRFLELRGIHLRL